MIMTATTFSFSPSITEPLPASLQHIKHYINVCAKLAYVPNFNALTMSVLHSSKTSWTPKLLTFSWSRRLSIVAMPLNVQFAPFKIISLPVYAVSTNTFLSTYGTNY
jgi:hypothetical protein